MTDETALRLSNAAVTFVLCWLLQSTLETRRKAREAAKEAEQHRRAAEDARDKLEASILQLRDKL